MCIRDSLIAMPKVEARLIHLSFPRNHGFIVHAFVHHTFGVCLGRHPVLFVHLRQVQILRDCQAHRLDILTIFGLLVASEVKKLQVDYACGIQTSAVMEEEGFAVAGNTSEDLFDTRAFQDVLRGWERRMTNGELL